MIYMLDILALVFLTGVFILALRNRKQEHAHVAFIILVCALGLWIVAITLVATSKALTGPSFLLYITSLWTALSAYMLFEYFPDNRVGRTFRFRLIWLYVISVATTIYRFYDEFLAAPDSHENIFLLLLFYLTGSWPVLVTLEGLLRSFRKLKRTENAGHVNRIKTLVFGGLLTVAFLNFFIFILSYESLLIFGIIGVNCSLCFMVALTYAAVFQDLSDIKGVFLRSLVFSLMVLIASSAITGLLILIGYINGGKYNTVAFMSGGLVIFTLLYLHFRHLQPRLDQLFFRNFYLNEELLSSFNTEIQALENTEQSLNFTMETMLGTLYRMIRFRRGLIITADKFRRVDLRSLGPVPEYLKAPALKVSILRRRLAAPLAREMRTMLLLKGDYLGAIRAGENLERDYQYIIKAHRVLIEKLKRDNFQALIPLVFRDQIFGYIVLGEKEDGRPYYQGDIQLLESARLPFTLALRNNIIFEEFRKLKEEDSPARREQKFPDKPDGSNSPETVLNPLVRAGVSAVRRQVRGKTLLYGDDKMKRLMDEIAAVAGRAQPVLIRGETGTGKELIARLLHQQGRGEEAPFTEANCAAIPAGLWESEVFGHEAGAFTDARVAHAGLVTQAGPGSLFFDEIGEMPLDVQPKILRLIQERTFKTVGGKKTLQADCRLIFATHRNLPDMVRDGLFREDLYYRINVFELNIPPLRERPADISLLVTYFIEKYGGESSPPVEAIEAPALESLLTYPWPGNIRELENTLLKILAGASRNIITLAEIPEYIRKSPGSVRTGQSGRSGPQEGELSENISQIGLERMVSDYTRELILHALRTCKGNKTHAAEMLGISRGKLKYQIKELNIHSF